MCAGSCTVGNKCQSCLSATKSSPCWRKKKLENSSLAQITKAGLESQTLQRLAWRTKRRECPSVGFRSISCSVTYMSFFNKEMPTNQPARQAGSCQRWLRWLTCQRCLTSSFSMLLSRPRLEAHMKTMQSTCMVRGTESFSPEEAWKFPPDTVFKEDYSAWSVCQYDKAPDQSYDIAYLTRESHFSSVFVLLKVHPSVCAKYDDIVNEREDMCTSLLSPRSLHQSS